jgi:hypothetical protein
MLSSRLPGLAAILFAGLSAAGCSSDVNPMKAAMVGAGYGPKAVDAPDFVEKSRRTDGTYMPIGLDAAKPTIRARNSTAQKSLEADLEAARTRNEARGKTAQGAGKGIAKDLKPAVQPAE